MDERLRSSGYVRIDETRVQVLNSDKAPSALHWMWVRVAGAKHQRIILFDYDPSRGGEVADALIEGCSGYLQSDGYQAYEGVSERAGLATRWVFCARQETLLRGAQSPAQRAAQTSDARRTKRCGASMRCT